MAGSVHHATPERLQIREGGGCIALFGLPFLAAGVFVLLAGVGVVPMSNSADVRWYAWPLLMLMGAAFTAVGGSLVFGRAWTTLDITQRTVSKQWNLLVRLRARTFPLDDYTAVTLGFVQGDSDSSDQFPVGLRSRAGADLRLRSFTSYAEARACAAAVAQHLHIDVEDASTDHPIRLSSSQIDDPFTRTAWRERLPREAAERPAGARSDVSRDADEVRIVIPNSGLHPIVLAAALIPVAIPLVVAPPLSAFFGRTHTPDPVAWTFLTFLIVFFGVLPTMTVVNGFLRSRRGRTIVVVSPRGIRIQERGAWRTRSVALLDAAEILDVDYSTRDSTLAAARRVADERVRDANHAAVAAVGPRTERVIAALSRFARGGGLTVKTPRGFTTLGKGLEDDEIRYLYSVVLHALKG